MFSRHFVRWITLILTLSLATVIIPHFSLKGILSMIYTSIAIVLVGFILEYLLGGELNPFLRGIIGSFSTFVGLLFWDWMYPKSIYLFGILFVSVIIGLIDFFVPVHERYR